MLRPSIFNDNLFDDFFEFPFFDDRAERKLYGHTSKNTKTDMSLRLIFRDFIKMRFRLS